MAAVSAANAGGGSVNLDAGCTYTLSSANNTTGGGNALPVITSDVTINGKDSTIAGSGLHVRILAIAPGASLTLNDVTVTGGHSMGPGGGIFNFTGTLTLNHSLVTGNRSAQAGGGIGSGFGAVTTLNKSEVSWNTVPSDAMGGGGIVSLASTLTLNNSTVDHNTGPGGGGIASGNGMGGGAGSTITLNKSVISDNTATAGPFSGGGGISNGGTLVSNDSQITGNSAPGGNGGGLLNHATATLNKTVVSGNTALDDTSGDTGDGGGIANANFGFPAPFPTLVLNNSQVTGNAVSDDGIGGGISNPDFGAGSGGVALHHSDVSSNTPDNCFPGGSIAGCIG